MFSWQKGDVLLIDNRLAMHSRNTFEPPRRVLASIGLDPLPDGAEQGGKGEIPYHVLRSGDRMPVVGVGMWKVPKDATADTVVAALKCGYRQ